MAFHWSEGDGACAIQPTLKMKGQGRLFWSSKMADLS